MSVDAATFRHVLGHVPTAVAVLTVRDLQGADHGMTVGSFTALSLDPPLVLACIGHDATIAAPAGTATHFGLSVLASDMQAVSERFADRETRGFECVGSRRGPAGTLLIDRAVAHLECRVTSRLPGGDHTILVGEVEYASATSGTPLVHLRGGYGRAER